jgi:hypothetical protein
MGNSIGCGSKDASSGDGRYDARAEFPSPLEVDDDKPNTDMGML